VQPDVCTTGARQRSCACTCMQSRCRDVKHSAQRRSAARTWRLCQSTCTQVKQRARSSRCATSAAGAAWRSQADSGNSTAAEAQGDHGQHSLLWHTAACNYPHQALGRLPIAPCAPRAGLYQAAWQSVSHDVQQGVAAEHAAAPAHRLRPVHRRAGQEAARERAGRARGQWRRHARARGEACIAAAAQACTAAEPRRQWRAGQREAASQPACAGRPCKQLQGHESGRPAPRRRAAACVSAGQPRRRRCVLGYHCWLSLSCTLPSSVTRGAAL